MLTTVAHDRRAAVILLIFLVLTGWWLFLSLFPQDQSQYYFFGAVYGLIALLGGVWGLTIAHKWGGLKSVVGKAIFCLSAGLLAQEFGQLVFSYHNILLHQEIPYPSIADLGFFGSVPLYIMGIVYLAKASGIQFTFERLSHKVQMILLPVIMLGCAYLFFLKDYEFDWSNGLRVLLDFGYPLGQAMYVSIALLTYSLSRTILGGVMKSKILFIIIAFIAQFIAEYNFLYQSSRGTWVNGGYGDYLYMAAYLLMTLGILQLNTIYDRLKQ